ncbi:S8 family serine peptidase [Ornithinimicrobium sufpigmenti]|uniref:S8 family serine peptidase n=1 Tax=Ornithinimicrobium sufpigmenti TaxID=2508882 RepID=UPI0015E16E6F|nr:MULTISPECIES: S8 family serine peptidase [unclassified Ornithinimicrobium]
MPFQPAHAARRRLPGARRLAYGVLATPLVLSPLATVAQGMDGPNLAAVAATDRTGAPETAAGAAGEGAETVTLITGDTVQLTTGPDGRQLASVRPAPDGRASGFWTHRDDGDLYVVPNGLMPLIPERLDPALFNVTDLVEAGYTDARMDSVPLILTYEEGTSVPAAAWAVDGDVDGDVQQLESINGLSITLDKDDDTAELATALEQLARGRQTGQGPLAGLDKVWLDHPVEAMLEHSVPQIGAPTAWEQGYDGSGVTVAVLDSGIDDEHPDLAGQVVASENFSDSDTAKDRDGHGTHVAATVAGTGAASDGRSVGVAPGAGLLNGKVLDDFGNGTTSGLIEGMEWAVEQGADVVNLSVGVRGFYSDGTDPGSMAVNALVEEHGTLFVIAAGNDGPGESTVTAPGSADLALTVGAVDRNEDIASFSSRGPRFGDHAVKPEITGPGVDIVAARAAGTWAGFPVDDSYTSMSGTSMAAPHVAGAAALVAQARPELTGVELRALLVGTAVPNEDLRVLDQGAGRVNVPTALTGEAIAEPVALHLGSYGFPHEQVQVEETVTYRNLGEEPLTLDLVATARNAEGEPAHQDAVSVSPTSLTVPAGESASATVTLDTAAPGVGQFGGAVVATSASGETVSTPLSYYKEPERYDVVVEGIARDGRPAQGSFTVLDVADGSVSATRNWGTDDSSCTTDSWAMSNCIRLEPGTYSISGVVFTMPEGQSSTAPPAFDEYALNTSLVADPEVTIDGPTTLTLDARDAVEVQIQTPEHEARPATGSALHVGLDRVAQDGTALSQGQFITPRTMVESRLFMTPTDDVQLGELSAYTQWTLEAPDVALQVAGNDALSLDPHYFDPYYFSDHSWQFPRLEGEHSLPVIDVGTATAEEIAGTELTGALALVRSSDALSAGEQSNNAAEAGAAMVAVYHDTPGSDPHPGATGILLEVPTVRLSHAEGTGLLELLGQGPVTVLAAGEPASPYRYNLRLTEEGGIPAELEYVLDTDELAAVTNGFHSQLSTEVTLTETWYTQRVGDNFAITFPTPTLGGPRERVDYYVADPGLEYIQGIETPENQYNYLWPSDPQARIYLVNQPQTFGPGERLERSWLQAPLRPGLWPERSIMRTEDFLDIRLAAFVDGEGNTSEGSTSYFDNGFDVTMRLFADGELVMESDYANGRLDLPPDAEDYRLEYEVDNHAPWAELATHTISAWTYQSTRPQGDQTRIEPLLTVDYDLDVDLQNRLRPASPTDGPATIEFTVRHQTGASQSQILPDASLDISYDGGTTWRSVENLRELENGRFAGDLPAEVPEQNDGTLSLRMSAQDAAGSTVEQEVHRAAGLPEPVEGEPVEVDRISGKHRYATAAATALAFGEVDTVYLASGQQFPDALSGVAPAVRDGAPVLLTRAGQLPSDTKAAMVELAPETVLVLGGDQAVSDTVLDEVGSLTGAKVSRVAGRDRYGTAAELALERFVPDDVDTVYVASGREFADSLSAGPLAGQGGDPVVLTKPDDLPSATIQALTALAPERIVVLGGEVAVDDAVYSELRGYADTVERLAGETRYETAAFVAERVAPTGREFVASGQEYADALSGGALAGLHGSPVLLTKAEELPSVTGDALTEREPSQVTLLGGELRIPDAVRAAIEELFRP